VVAVEAEPDPLHDFRDFRIVDGQQRLTTLSVAIAALRDVAAEDEPSQFDRLNAKYLVNTTEPKASDRWARLVPGEEDEQAYWTVLTDPANSSGHTAIGNAYRFFLKHITALRDDGDLQTERLATTIGDRLSLVFVTVNEGERPHKIFESINATGVGLSQSDLLRNYLFMALGQRSNNVYARYWRPLERALGTEGLEGLVRDNLQSSGEFVRQNEVYRTARGQLEHGAGNGIGQDQPERDARRAEHQRRRRMMGERESDGHHVGRGYQAEVPERPARIPSAGKCLRPVADDPPRVRHEQQRERRASDRQENLGRRVFAVQGEAGRHEAGSHRPRAIPWIEPGDLPTKPAASRVHHVPSPGPLGSGPA
jgi:hypothetical protein